MPASTRLAGSGTAAHVALAVLLAACADTTGDTDSGATLVVQRETIGDTTVVRTVSGSVWGDSATLVPDVNIGVLDGDEQYMFGNVLAIAQDSMNRLLVLDGQANAIRVYAANGDYIATWGRNGAGPGEFRNPDRGMAVLPDGRTAVRDPGNARIQLFTPAGESADVWPVVSGQWRSREPLFRHADTLLTLQPDGLMQDIANVQTAFVRIGPDGTLLDTLPLPALGDRMPQLVARRGGNTAQIDVPWAPGPVWTWHHDGYFVFGRSERYAIVLDAPGGVRRLERAVQPIRIADGEREQEIARATAGMRWLDSSWVWNGPDVPESKPAFERFYVATDGRLWVLRTGEAVPIANPEVDANEVMIAWTERMLFDVFDRDGSFLGSVPAPTGFKADRQPVIDGDGMWAVIDAESGEQRVVHYRLTIPLPGAN